MKRILVTFGVALGLGYVGICAFMYAQQRSLQYHPDPTAMSPPSPRIAAETLTTPDGERIVLWWAAPADDAKPVYLYLHGNGRNLLARSGRFLRLIEDGSGLMAVSWRGYGGSSGVPSEDGWRIDALAAYRTLAQRVAPTRIVVFGESLGTTVSVMLAAEARIAGLVLDSAFSSALDVAASAYPWLPVSLLLRDQYRADLAAPRVRVPTLQIHCRQDRVTPFAVAERLHALLPSREPMIVVDEMCHPVNLLRFEAPLRAFVARAVGAAR